MKYLGLTWIMLVVIVFVLPVTHAERFNIINGDTKAHLDYFDSIKQGEGNPLYFGQEIVGKMMIWLERVSGVGISMLFMWFNFISLALVGIVCSIFVYVITKNMLASCLTAFLSIFNGSMMHMFFSGTIFNIIEIGILFPIFIMFVWWIVKSKKWIWSIAIIPFIVLLFTFHPALGGGITTFGRTDALYEKVPHPLLALTLFFGFVNIGLSIYLTLFGKKEYFDKYQSVVMKVLGIGILVFGIMAFTGMSYFSNRIAINMVVLMIFAMCIGIGVVSNGRSMRMVDFGIAVISMVSFLPEVGYYLTK